MWSNQGSEPLADTLMHIGDIIIAILIAACGLGLFESAFALPPLSRAGSSLPTAESARSTLAVDRLLSRPVNTSTVPLDLRPPQEPRPESVHEGAGTPGWAPFPSAVRHLESGTEDRLPPAGFGAEAASFQQMSPAQLIAQRMQRLHREGLPIAHLWESKSAALNIGLNQRGRPGLWFTQRMH